MGTQRRFIGAQRRSRFCLAEARSLFIQLQNPRSLRRRALSCRIITHAANIANVTSRQTEQKQRNLPTEDIVYRYFLTLDARGCVNDNTWASSSNNRVALMQRSERDARYPVSHPLLIYQKMPIILIGSPKHNA
jgi:hypothetical protein